MVHLAEQLAHVLDTVYNLSSPELAHLVRQCTETFADWFEAVPMPLMVTDYWGNIYEVNQAAAAVVHMRSQWLVRKPLVVFVPLQDRHAFRILLHHLIQGEPQWSHAPASSLTVGARFIGKTGCLEVSERERVTRYRRF